MDFFAPFREKLFLRLFDNADLFLLYLDAEGKVLAFNRKIGQVTGKANKDISGRHWSEVLYRSNNPMKQQMLKAVIDDAVTYKRPTGFEDVLNDVSGNAHIIFWSITPMPADKSGPGGILLAGNDFTEQRQRKASYEKLDETLRGIFSGIKEYGLFVVNLEGNITYYSTGSEIMFGWSKNEIIFKHLSILFPPEGAKESLPDILEELKSKGRYEEEAELLKKDGESFPVILTGSRFFDSESKLIGYIFIAKDITEIRRLEYQVFQADKLAAIGHLATAMAHEINNPLFVISGRLAMLLEQKDLPAQFKQELEIINTQADRIKKLVEQILKFGRKAPKRAEKIDLNEVIETVLPFIAYHKQPGADGEVEIEKHLHPGPIYVRGNLNQLQEVFVNMLLNACQAMPGGGKVAVSTEVSPDRFATARISDSGCGIRQQDIKNLFMPFFSTKKSGTGLGLSISYNIIKNHNGMIEVESRTGKDSGTVFTIKVPLAM